MYMYKTMCVCVCMYAVSGIIFLLTLKLNQISANVEKYWKAIFTPIANIQHQAKEMINRKHDKTSFKSIEYCEN